MTADGSSLIPGQWIGPPAQPVPIVNGPSPYDRDDRQLPQIPGAQAPHRAPRALRAHSDVPIIMISGRDSEIEKVVGLELGADDYLVKPFLMRELIARMRAVHRRHRPRFPEAPGPAPEPGTRATYGRTTIDRRAHRVFLDGAEIPLRPKEYALLTFLVDRRGALVPREAIMTAVWGDNGFGSTKTLDVHVAALRHKLGDALVIECVRGVGFRMVLSPGSRAISDNHDRDTALPVPTRTGQTSDARMEISSVPRMPRPA
ncbi:response regulator transcription factor [Streptomyces sp. Li-HN-5-11]|uniref:response regulator transcription factor n=1 Tax=Streptomyces sp. Li-HN-5-11 TaxID=3075432 RepID=UPI0037DA14B6